MSYMSKYEIAQRDANTFDGMMNPLSVAIFQAFLSFQKAEGITGDMMEFGVYRGKSASVLLNNLDAGETLHMVDVQDYPELDKLSKISPAFTFTRGKSEDLFRDEAYLKSLPDRVRFSHHDASHSFINVTSEMEAMSRRIGPQGLMVLDDFGNPSYFQVVAACFTYLARNDCPLEILLYSNNKAYLCRKDDFGLFKAFVIRDLLAQINSLDIPKCFLTRTEDHDGYRGFSLVPKTKPDQPDLYGQQIFGDRFYRV